MRLDIVGGQPPLRTAWRLLDGIDLAVEPGEVVALIGPSGCGKSTLLAILGGLLRAVGRPGDPGRRPAGGLPGADDLCVPGLRAAALGARWRATSPWWLEGKGIDAAERRARVDEVLATTGLGDFRHAFPKQLSGGMRQRVGHRPRAGRSGRRCC